MGKAAPKNRAKSGRKSKVAKAVPLTANDALDFDTEQTETGDVVREVIEDLLWKGSWIILQHIVEQKAQDQTTEAGLACSIEALEFATMTHDYGEAQETIQIDGSTSKVNAVGDPCSSSSRGSLAMQQNWTCGEEPQCIPIDRWGTGVIGVKTRPRVTSLAIPDPTSAVSQEDDMSRRSATSAAPTGTARSTMSTSGVKRKSQKKKNTKPPAKPERIQVKRTPDALQREATRLVELKKLEKKKKQRLRAQFIRLQELEEKARYDKIQKDLKGKNYTLDEEGNVILISDPKPDRMPSLAIGPAVNVREHNVNDDEENEDSTQSKSTRPTKNNSNNNKNRKRKNSGTNRNKPMGRVPYVDMMTALGPPVISVFDANQGVTMTQGLNVKTTEKVKDTSSLLTMTRAEYNRRIEEQQGKPAVTRTLEPPALKPASIPPSRTSPRESNGEGDTKEAGSLGAGLAPPAELSPLDPKSLPRNHTPPGHAQTAKSDDDAFNMSILSDPNWGEQHKLMAEEERVRLRTPSLPLNSPQQRADQRDKTLPKRARQPRDRPYAEPLMAVGGRRSRLPPPVYPATLGHGFSGYFDADATTGADSLGVTLPAISTRSLASVASAPDLMRTSHRGELGKIVYASESAKHLF